MLPDLPRRRAVAEPKRLAAVAGAVCISALTVAGALGIGPGAAMGDSPQQAESHRASSGGSASGGSASEGSATEGSAPEGTDAGTGDEWLNIEEGPSGDTPPGDRAEADVPPALPAKSGAGKRVVFDMSDQQVWLVSGRDTVVRTYPVSGSKYENLDAGRYEVYSTSRNAVSYNHSETMNYMVRFTEGENAPIGFHDVPRHEDGTLVQTRAELGTPLSAGCVRQWVSDARALWDFAPVGTRVVVLA